VSQEAQRFSRIWLKSSTALGRRLLELPLRAALGLAAAVLFAMVLLPGAAWASDLVVREIRLEPCPEADVGAQPEQKRPSGASCYALRGEVVNPGKRPVVDTDVFAQILDSSGEPVLQNRSRVGSIGDIPPGVSAFALRLSVPAGTPGPLQVSHAKAKGFSAPVRCRASEDDELLPLEQALVAN